MCLLFVAYNLSSRYRFVIAANRDEFFDRPTAPLDYLDGKKSILGGRDLQGGGTWLGVSRDLRFGAITNYRDTIAVKSDAPSRGEIVYNYLGGQKTGSDYLKDLSHKANCYAGFNVVFGDRRGLFYYSNKSGDVRQLGEGFYGLSNHLLDTPWPKVTRGKYFLQPCMVTESPVDVERIFELLRDDAQPEDKVLPDTGVGLSLERLLAPIFICGEGYGTRSSAIITVTHEGEVHFSEKTYHRSITSNASETLVQRSLNV